MLFRRTRTRVFFNANICQLPSAASFRSSHLSVRFLEGSAEVVCFVIRLVSLCRQHRGSQHADLKVRETRPMSVSQIPMCTGHSPVTSGTNPVAHKSQRTQVSVIGLFFSSCSQHAPCNRSSQNRGQSGPRSLRPQLTFHKHCKDTCARTRVKRSQSRKKATCRQSERP